MEGGALRVRLGGGLTRRQVPIRQKRPGWPPLLQLGSLPRPVLCIESIYAGNEVNKIPTIFVRDMSKQPALVENVIEGLVWHHDDGRMAKIKRRDFGLKW